MFIDKCPASAASQYFVKCWKDILGKRMQLILLIWFDIEHANYITQLTKLKKKEKEKNFSPLLSQSEVRVPCWTCLLRKQKKMASATV